MCDLLVSGHPAGKSRFMTAHEDRRIVNHAHQCHLLDISQKTDTARRSRHCLVGTISSHHDMHHVTFQPDRATRSCPSYQRPHNPNGLYPNHRGPASGAVVVTLHL